MNFLFLNSSRSKWGGGNEKSILLATKALAKHKTVLAYRNEQVGEHFNIPKYKLPFLNEADLTTIIKLIAIVKKHQIDVIIPSMRKDYALAGIVSTICGVKNVLWLGTTLDLKNKWVYNLVFNLMADGIIVNAEKIREILLLSRFMRPENIKVIYYGLDPAAIAQQTREKEICKPFPFMITAMGRIEPNKGFDFLIRSFARFLNLTSAPDAGIVIMGHGPQLEEYKQLAANLGIAHHIIFTGFMANPFPYLKQSDIFTLTSIVEGLSIALLEAMFLGVAPISTYAGGVEEVITDGTNGFLIHYGDEKKLAELLAMLYRDPGARKEIAATARKTIAPMFSLDKLQEEIISFCQTTSRKQKKKRPFRHRFAKMLQCITKKRTTKPVPDKPLESIIILAKERYGDCIMLTPLIGSLRREFPELLIYIITFNQIIFDFFSADPNITAVYHTKKNLKRYGKEILSKKFDLLFNPKDHPSTNFLIHSTLIRARYKIAHFNTFHEGLYDHLINSDPKTHESAKNLAILSVIDSTLQPGQCKPYLPSMPVSTDITTFLQTVHPGLCIGINISAGHSGGHRSIKQWAELISRFPDETFVIFSAPGDLEEKKELEGLQSSILPSPSTANLYEVGEIVKKLKLLITPDTALVHVASCFDTPLIGLYRNTQVDHNQFGPMSTMQEVIISPTPNVVDIENDAISLSLNKMLTQAVARDGNCSSQKK